MAFLLGLLELLHQACERKDSPDRDRRQGRSRYRSHGFAFEIGCRLWNHVPPPTWQQHHHMEWDAIDPYRKQRERLPIQGVGRISDGNLTTDFV